MDRTGIYSPLTDKIQTGTSLELRCPSAPELATLSVPYVPSVPSVPSVPRAADACSGASSGARGGLREEVKEEEVLDGQECRRS
jgi:hypothetical protein